MKPKIGRFSRMLLAATPTNISNPYSVIKLQVKSYRNPNTRAYPKKHLSNMFNLFETVLQSQREKVHRRFAIFFLDKLI